MMKINQGKEGETGMVDLLIRLAMGIAKQFGNNCEVVILDLTKNPYENTIIFIENGHITNRKVGDGPSSVVLETLLQKPEEVEDRLCYLTEGPNGRILKSSTIYIRDDEGKITGIFGINYDISAMVMLESTLHDFVSVETSLSRERTHIPKDVNDLLDDLIKNAVKRIGRPVAFMTREDKIEAIRFLKDSGALLIKKSGDKISEYFGISKFTLYSYIDMEKGE